MLESSVLGSVFAIISLLGFLVQVLFYLGYSVGLYFVNKKLGEPHPWLSFIPVIQIYPFVKAAGKDGIWILWLVLGFIFLLIPGLIVLAILCNGISKRTGGGFWRAVGIFFFPYIVLPIVGLTMSEQTSTSSESKQDDNIYV